MRILGVDLGSTSVKAVEIETRMGSFVIYDYHEEPIIAGADPFQAVQTLMLKLAKVPDRIAIAMKTSRVTFRSMQLPTKDKKAIMAGVGFELEDDLPFPIENSIYDYTVLSTSGQTSQVHVATTLIKYVEETITQFSAAAADPDVITTEAWAFRTLLKHIPSIHSQEHPVLVVHIGHQRTVIYVHWRGQPVVAREISWGGRDLTTAICRKFGIPIEQAEQSKSENGFVLPESQRAGATPEQLEFSDCLMEPLQELVREIRQAELTCKNLTHENVATVFVSGGTSLLPGFCRTIEESLRLTVNPLRALSSIGSAGGVTYSEQSDASFSLAAALSLCMVGESRAGSINLRKGSLVKQGRSANLNFAAAKKPLLAAAAVLICLISSTAWERAVYQNRLRDLDTRLERSVKDFFGGASGSAVKTYISSTSTLKQNIEKELNKAREAAKLVGANPRSPINFLKEISTSISKDVVVDMMQFQVGATAATPYAPTEETGASLTFLVSNPQVAEKLATLLGSKLSGLDRSKIEEVPSADGSSKKMKITFSGKPTEESYGK